jgi:hypothetical protein
MMGNTEESFSWHFVALISASYIRLCLGLWLLYDCNTRRIAYDQVYIQCPLREDCETALCYQSSPAY